MKIKMLWPTCFLSFRFFQSAYPMRRHGTLLGLFSRGFTLAEVLVVIALIALLLILSVPLILSAGQTQTWNAVAKQGVQIVSNAYIQYQLNQMTKPDTTLRDIMDYVHYTLGPEKTGQINVNLPEGDEDDPVESTSGEPSVSCHQSHIDCFRLHNNSILWYDNTQTFGGTESFYAMRFAIDTDGEYKAGPDAPQSIEFLLYADGRVYTWGSLRPGTRIQGQPVSSRPHSVPAWFTW